MSENPLLSTEQRLALWLEIKSGETPDWEDGKAFEHLIVQLFEAAGGDVTYPFSVTNPHGGVLEQLDGFVQIDGISLLLETKDYKDKVAVEPIAKLRNQLLRRPAGIVGCVFTKSDFTGSSIMLANFMAPQAILLWAGVEIDAIVWGECIKTALKIKHRRLLRDGMPYFDFRGELA